MEEIKKKKEEQEVSTWQHVKNNDGVKFAFLSYGIVIGIMWVMIFFCAIIIGLVYYLN